MRLTPVFLTAAIALVSMSANAQKLTNPLKPRVLLLRGDAGLAPAADAGPPAATANLGELATGESKRADYVKKTRAKIAATVDPKNRKDHKIRTMVGLHWRHAMRLIRIRNLAEAANDGVMVARAQAQLDRIDKSFYTSLKVRNDEVTKDGGAK